MTVESLSDAEPEATEQADQDEKKQMLELAFQANFEIFKLAEAVGKMCEGEDHPLYHGMMARIQTLSDIVFHAAGLGGSTDHLAPDLNALERAYKGMLS